MNTAPANPGPGRPKDLEKRAAILDAAGTLFLENGFIGTSMDAIASAAGVSKLTVYSHFGDKDNLFREVIDDACQRMLPDELYRFDDLNSDRGTSLRDALVEIARTHVRLMISPEAIGVWRAINSDCQNGSPRMGALFWEAGPGRSRKLMERFLADQVAAGRLEIDDIERATSQLLTLLKGDTHSQLLLGCMPCGCDKLEATALANAEAAVDMFLRAYTPRGSTPA